MKTTQELLSKKELKENFVKIYAGVHSVPVDRAQQMLEVETFNFMKLMHDKPDLEACTELSQRGVFLDVISAGLSFSAASKLVYVQSRNRKTGRQNDQGRDIYETVMEFSPSPKGKVYLCQRVGSIDCITEPEPVYSDDVFKHWTVNNIKHVEHHPAADRKGHVVAIYCFVIFPNGAREAVVIDSTDIERRKKASERANGKKIDGVFRPGNANPLYTSFRGGIDPGFFGAKIIDKATKYLRKQEINSIYAGGDDPEEETWVPGAEGENRSGPSPVQPTAEHPADPTAATTFQIESFATVAAQDDTF